MRGVLPAISNAARIVAREVLRGCLAIRPKYYLPLGLLLVMASPVFPQTGQIPGTVRDQQQAVVAGAKITVRDARNQVVATQVINGEGTYSFSSLAPGTYDVEGQAAGFKISIVHGVRVEAGESARLNISLGLESQASAITVQGTAEEGYRVDSITSVGPFPTMNVLDTPYTYTVVPQELINNVQSSSAEPLGAMATIDVLLQLLMEAEIPLNVTVLVPCVAP